jgi:beta-lactamase superfamily II metal-dependent hydrolase
MFLRTHRLVWSVVATVIACVMVGRVIGQGAAVGAVLPAWQPGQLDIHQISTGRGNSAFMVMPDGTTLLFDAGAAGDGVPFTDPRPNATRTPGGWIVDYIRATHPKGAAASLDYALLSHFHADHMGQPLPTSKDSGHGYKLFGITEVGDALGIGMMVDRAWPTYDYPSAIPGAWMPEYRAFVTYQQQARAMKVERLAVGRRDQIVLRNDAARYPSFEVRGISANGDVWTGQGEGVAHTFPPLAGLAAGDMPTENMSSLGIRVSYGAFDYFTGGDIPGIPDDGFPAWHSVETPVATALGEVDAHVVNHHGSISPASATWLGALQSRVIVLPSWSPTHPSQDVLKRMLNTRIYPGERDIFATYVSEPTKVSIGARAQQFKADHGHIVIRVDAGGAAYRVFVLDDLTPDRRVTAVFGPYSAR